MLFVAVLVLTAKPRSLILAHYMPWFAAPPASKEWGWHWTMGKLKPDGKKGSFASHYVPLIGLYDSGDPDVVECQTLLMKFAGIDGVLADWYGTVDLYDYGQVNRNTQLLFEAAKRTGLKFGIVYEDQTVPNLIKNKRFTADQAVDQGKLVMKWLEKTWFGSPAYLKQDGRPVLMVFGPQYYKPEDYAAMFEGLSRQPAFYTLHHRRGPAVGAFDWPLPQRGDQSSWTEHAAFYDRAKEWPNSVPVAYPRFDDFYKDGGVSDGYPKIGDGDGTTYSRTLTEALQSGQSMIQLATWNDWGEGTQIEPSVEFGYRDLETTQRLRKRLVDPKFPYTAADLRLPIKLLELRRKQDNRAGKLALLLLKGDLKSARLLLRAEHV